MLLPNLSVKSIHVQPWSTHVLRTVRKFKLGTPLPLKIGNLEKIMKQHNKEGQEQLFKCFIPTMEFEMVWSFFCHI